MNNTDKLRQHYLSMPHYHFDMTIDDYDFSNKDQADIAKYGENYRLGNGKIRMGQIDILLKSL